MDRQSQSDSNDRISTQTPPKRLTSRQRRVLSLLGLGNLLLFSLLGWLLLSDLGSQDQVPLLSPTVGALLPLDQRDLCRDRASQALLEAGLVGTVHAGRDGALSVQIVRHSGFDCDVDACSNPVPALAFDGVWLVLQALGPVADEGCSAFDRLDVDVIVRTSGQASFEAHGQVRLPDLALWTGGGIDDGELSNRLIFQTTVVPGSWLAQPAE